MTKYILKKEITYKGEKQTPTYKTKHFSSDKIDNVKNDCFYNYNEAFNYMLECLEYERQINNKDFKINYDIIEL